MKRISKEELERLRQSYPVGTRVELLVMDDIQAPPIGTLGTGAGVDSVGTSHVNWDNGCGLGVAYGADACRRVEA